MSTEHPPQPAEFSVLCVLPGTELYHATGWESYLPGARPGMQRELVCALTSAYRYDGSGKTLPVDDWEASLGSFELLIDNLLPFGLLRDIVAEAVGDSQGLFVCSGVIRDDLRRREMLATTARTASRRVAGCSSISYASVAREATQLEGFDPSSVPDRYMLSWFGGTTGSVELIQKRYESFSQSSDDDLLPLSPSPAEETVELLVIDSESTAVYVFAGSRYQQRLLNAIARGTRYPVITARPKGGSVVDWVEMGADPSGLTLLPRPAYEEDPG